MHIRIRFRASKDVVAMLTCNANPSFRKLISLLWLTVCMGCAWSLSHQFRPMTCAKVMTSRCQGLRLTLACYRPTSRTNFFFWLKFSLTILLKFLWKFY